MTLSFIIPVRNDASRLRSCLQSISANTVKPLECIVADNGSTDDSAGVAASFGARVVALPGLKVAELRNRAARLARGEILAFVDADHVLSSRWIDVASRILADGRFVAAGAIYSSPPEGTWVQRYYGKLRGRTMGSGPTKWIGSGNLAVRRPAFDAVGGFDTGLTTCEDVDLCARLRARSWEIQGDERLQSFHLGDPATLRELFQSERWRGRDNLRVSLRVAVAVRDLPSIVIPLAEAVALASLPILVVARSVGLPIPTTWFAWPFALIFGLAALRALRMERLTWLRRPGGMAPAMAVALAYDLGRACALILPAPHRRRTPDE